jgi:hypothetical protein
MALQRHQSRCGRDRPATIAREDWVGSKFGDRQRSRSDLLAHLFRCGLPSCNHGLSSIPWGTRSAQRQGEPRRSPIAPQPARCTHSAWNGSGCCASARRPALRCSLLIAAPLHHLFFGQRQLRKTAAAVLFQSPRICLSNSSEPPFVAGIDRPSTFASARSRFNRDAR